MSTAYSIACRETEKALWIGQRDFIYTSDDEIMTLLKSFLFEHAGKPLVFCRSEDVCDFEDYAKKGKEL